MSPTWDLVVDLEDGRGLHVPLEWFPRLVKATAEERNNVRLIGRGIGMHWPDIDEDISVSGLLMGRQHELPAGSTDKIDIEDDGDDESPSGKGQVGEVRS